MTDHTDNTDIAITKLYSTLEVSQILGLGSDYVRQLARTKQLGHIRRGRKIFCTAQDINKYRSGVRVEAVVEVDQ